VKDGTVRSTSLVGVLILLTSCGDGQAPADVMFDVAGTSEALVAVRDVVMSPALDAHVALAPRFTTPDAGPAAAAHPMPATERIGVLPAEYLGTTFTLEAAEASYQPSELAGAPGDALRYVVYSVDDSGVPVVASAIGHADLTDDGVELEQGFAVGVLVTVDDLVVADYSTSFEAEGGTAALARTSAFDHIGLNIAGVLRTPTDEIQIDLVTGTVNGIVTTEFTFVSGAGTMTGEMMVEESSTLSVLQGEFQLGEDRLTVTANGAPGAFAAAIAVNGNDWATVSVQPASITVTGDVGVLDSTEQSVALRMAEYFLMVPNLASGLVAGVLAQ